MLTIIAYVLQNLLAENNDTSFCVKTREVCSKGMKAGLVQELQSCQLN